MEGSVSLTGCEQWSRSILKKLALSKPSPDQAQKMLTRATIALYEGFSYLEVLIGERDGTARTDRTDPSCPHPDRRKYLQSLRLLALKAQETEQLSLPQICDVVHLACRLLRCQSCGRLLLPQPGSDVSLRRSRSCPKSTVSLSIRHERDKRRAPYYFSGVIASTSETSAPVLRPPCEACTLKTERVQRIKYSLAVSIDSVFCHVLVCVALSLRNVLQLGVFPALLPCTSNYGDVPDARNKIAAEAVRAVLVASDIKSGKECAVRSPRGLHISVMPLCVDLWSYLRQAVLIHAILESDLSVENDILYPMFRAWLRLDANDTHSNRKMYVEELWVMWSRCFFASVSKALHPPGWQQNQISLLWTALTEQINIVSNVIRALRSSSSHQERLRSVLKTWMDHYATENGIQGMIWPLRDPACVFQSPTNRSGALKWLRHFLGFFPCVPSNAFPSKQTVMTTIYANVTKWLITVSELLQDTRPATQLRLAIGKTEACDAQESQRSTLVLNIHCDLDELTVELQVLVFISDQLISAVAELEEWSPLLAARSFVVDTFQRRRWISLLTRILQYEEQLASLVNILETHRVFKTLWLERLIGVQEGSGVDSGFCQSTECVVLLRYLLPKLRLCLSDLWVGKIRRRVLALCMTTYRVLSRLRKDVLASVSERTSTLQNQNEKPFYAMARYGRFPSFSKVSREWAIEIIDAFECLPARSFSGVGGGIQVSERNHCIRKSRTRSSETLTEVNPLLENIEELHSHPFVTAPLESVLDVLQNLVAFLPCFQCFAVSGRQSWVSRNDSKVFDFNTIHRLTVVSDAINEINDVDGKQYSSDSASSSPDECVATFSNYYAGVFCYVQLIHCLTFGVRELEIKRVGKPFWIWLQEIHAYYSQKDPSSAQRCCEGNSYSNAPMVFRNVAETVFLLSSRLRTLPFPVKGMTVGWSEMLLELLGIFCLGVSVEHTALPAGVFEASRSAERPCVEGVWEILEERLHLDNMEHTGFGSWLSAHPTGPFQSMSIQEVPESTQGSNNFYENGSLTPRLRRFERKPEVCSSAVRGAPIQGPASQAQQFEEADPCDLLASTMLLFYQRGLRCVRILQNLIIAVNGQVEDARLMFQIFGILLVFLQTSSVLQETGLGAAVLEMNVDCAAVSKETFDCAAGRTAGTSAQRLDAGFSLRTPSSSSSSSTSFAPAVNARQPYMAYNEPLTDVNYSVSKRTPTFMVITQLTGTYTVLVRAYIRAAFDTLRLYSHQTVLDSQVSEGLALQRLLVFSAGRKLPHRFTLLFLLLGTLKEELPRLIKRGGTPYILQNLFNLPHAWFYVLILSPTAPLLCEKSLNTLALDPGQGWHPGTLEVLCAQLEILNWMHLIHTVPHGLSQETSEFDQSQSVTLWINWRERVKSIADLLDQLLQNIKEQHVTTTLYFRVRVSDLCIRIAELKVYNVSLPEGESYACVSENWPLEVLNQFASQLQHMANVPSRPSHETSAMIGDSVPTSSSGVGESCCESTLVHLKAVQKGSLDACEWLLRGMNLCFTETMGFFKSTGVITTSSENVVELFSASFFHLLDPEVWRVYWTTAWRLKDRSVINAFLRLYGETLQLYSRCKSVVDSLFPPYLACCSWSGVFTPKDTLPPFVFSLVLVSARLQLICAALPVFLVSPIWVTFGQENTEVECSALDIGRRKEALLEIATLLVQMAVTAVHAFRYQPFFIDTGDTVNTHKENGQLINSWKRLAFRCKHLATITSTSVAHSPQIVFDDHEDQSFRTPRRVGRGGNSAREATLPEQPSTRALLPSNSTCSLPSDRRHRKQKRLIHQLYAYDMAEAELLLSTGEWGNLEQAIRSIREKVVPSNVGGSRDLRTSEVLRLLLFLCRAQVEWSPGLRAEALFCATEAFSECSFLWRINQGQLDHANRPVKLAKVQTVLCESGNIPNADDVSFFERNSVRSPCNSHPDPATTTARGLVEDDRDVLNVPSAEWATMPTAWLPFFSAAPHRSDFCSRSNQVPLTQELSMTLLDIVCNMQSTAFTSQSRNLLTVYVRFCESAWFLAHLWYTIGAVHWAVEVASSTVLLTASRVASYWPLRSLGSVLLLWQLKRLPVDLQACCLPSSRSETHTGQNPWCITLLQSVRFWGIYLSALSWDSINDGISLVLPKRDQANNKCTIVLQCARLLPVLEAFAVGEKDPWWFLELLNIPGRVTCLGTTAELAASGKHAGCLNQIALARFQELVSLWSLMAKKFKIGLRLDQKYTPSECKQFTSWSEALVYSQEFALRVYGALQEHLFPSLHQSAVEQLGTRNRQSSSGRQMPKFSNPSNAPNRSSVRKETLPAPVTLIAPLRKRRLTPLQLKTLQSIMHLLQTVHLQTWGSDKSRYTAPDASPDTFNGSQSSNFFPSFRKEYLNLLPFSTVFNALIEGCLGHLADINAPLRCRTLNPEAALPRLAVGMFFLTIAIVETALCFGGYFFSGFKDTSGHALFALKDWIGIGLILLETNYVLPPPLDHEVRMAGQVTESLIHFFLLLYARHHRLATLQTLRRYQRSPPVRNDNALSFTEVPCDTAEYVCFHSLLKHEAEVAATGLAAHFFSLDPLFCFNEKNPLDHCPTAWSCIVAERQSFKDAFCRYRYWRFLPAGVVRAISKLLVGSKDTQGGFWECQTTRWSTQSAWDEVDVQFQQFLRLNVETIKAAEGEGPNAQEPPAITHYATPSKRSTSKTGPIDQEFAAPTPIRSHNSNLVDSKAGHGVQHWWSQRFVAEAQLWSIVNVLESLFFSSSPTHGSVAPWLTGWLETPVALEEALSVAAKSCLLWLETTLPKSQSIHYMPNNDLLLVRLLIVLVHTCFSAIAVFFSGDFSASNVRYSQPGCKATDLLDGNSSIQTDTHVFQDRKNQTWAQYLVQALLRHNETYFRQCVSSEQIDGFVSDNNHTQTLWKSFFEGPVAQTKQFFLDKTMNRLPKVGSLDIHGKSLTDGSDIYKLSPTVLFLNGFDTRAYQMPWDIYDSLRLNRISLGVDVTTLLAHYFNWKTSKKHEDERPGPAFDICKARKVVIVNPSNDMPESLSAIPSEWLPSTFEGSLEDDPLFEKRATCCVGFHPNVADTISYWTKHDLYVYCGHGGGTQFVSREEIQKTGWNNVAESASATDTARLKVLPLLMGCASLQFNTLENGPNQEVDSLAFDFLVGGSPGAFGLCWEVTDLDLDRYTRSLLETWTLRCLASKEGGASVSLKSNAVSCTDANSSIDGAQTHQWGLLLSAKSAAKRACYLKSVTGGACIYVGVPF